MRKRGAHLLAAFCVFFLGILRCSTHGEAPPIGYDEILEFAQPRPKITAPTSITVVRGETTTVPIEVSAATFAGLSGLPAGVSASAFSGTDITLSADINAPSAKTTANLTATTADASSISKSVTVYVTGVDGSRDPKFGTPYLGDDAVGLVVLLDGRVITLNRNSVLSRFTPSGAMDTSFGAGGRVTLPFAYSFGVDLASDGRMAIAGTSGVVVVGVDGTIERTITIDANTFSNVRVIWSGTNIVLVETNLISSIDSNGNVISASLTTPCGGAYPTLGARIALTSTAIDPDGGAASPQMTMLALSQGSYVIDGTFGSGGVSTFADGYPQITSVATTSLGALMVQASGKYASDIVRLDGNGGFDPSWGQQGYASVIQTPGAIVTTPSSHVLATGVTYDSLVAVERFLPDGTLDPAFGFAGRAVTDLSTLQTTAGATPPIAAIDAAETVLYVAVDGFLLRYRIHA